MSKLGKFVQASADNLLYALDYSQWLSSGGLSPGQTVSTATFQVTSPNTSPPLAIGSVAISTTVGPKKQPIGTMVGFYVSGGVTGNTYEATVTVTTSAGQKKEDYLYFKVQDPP